MMKSSGVRLGLGAAAIAVSVSLTPSGASAGCHLIDCVENVRIRSAQLKGKNCETLWILRNSIYKDAGYCFASGRGAKWFSNDGCKFKTLGEVPLSAIQRGNAATLRLAERAKGC